MEINSIKIESAVVVGQIIFVSIIIIDIITGRIVGDTFVRVGKPISSLIVSIDNVFDNQESGTQTPEIGTNVMCYHMDFMVVG